MPRLNIYIPKELDDDLSLYRDEMNLSEICTNAIRSEIRSRQSGRAGVVPAGAAEWTRSAPESELARRFDLRLVRVVPTERLEDREPVAKVVAECLDALVRDGMQIAIGGGSLVYATVQHLRPRNVRAHISAIGFGHVDREVPHLHPNTIVTRLSLLYSRSTVALVGDPMTPQRWPVSGERSGEELMRVIVGGCGRWRRDYSLARILGPEIGDVLEEKKVFGNFMGVFLSDDGQPVEPYLPSAPVTHLGSAALYAYSKRQDTLVLMVVSSFLKIPSIERALALRLCNALIVDAYTADVLLQRARAGTTSVAKDGPRE